MSAPATAASSLRIWVLLDDRAGNRSQCLGVAEALGVPFETREISYTAAGGLPNAVRGASFLGIERASRESLAPPWPDLLIAAGRRTGPAARAIKRQSEGAAFLVQIMYPGAAGIDDFDLVAVPSHDTIPWRGNMFAITGAPHRVTPARLADASEGWQARFSDLPRPWIALIVGGGTRRRRFTTRMARDLGRRAGELARREGGSLLITTSRRTGAAADTLLAAADASRFVYRWGDPGDNPYQGYLALADYIIVTGDSVSMCSEACAATAPVYLYAPPELTSEKHARLHRALYDAGYARPFDGRLEQWNHPRLNAAETIAAAVRERLAGRL